MESGITNLDAPYPGGRRPYTDIDEHFYADDSDLDDEVCEGEVPSAEDPVQASSEDAEKDIIGKEDELTVSMYSDSYRVLCSSSPRMSVTMGQSRTKAKAPKVGNSGNHLQASVTWEDVAK